MLKRIRNWVPSCEQAKYIAISFRLFGAGFFAAFGYAAIIGVIDHESVPGTSDPLFQAILSALIWIVAEIFGVIAIGKGGVHEL